MHVLSMFSGKLLLIEQMRYCTSQSCRETGEDAIEGNFNRKVMRSKSITTAGVRIQPGDTKEEMLHWATREGTEFQEV